MKATPLNLRSVVNGPEGYSTALSLNADELELIRQVIRVQWLYRLQLLAPKQVREFDGCGLERYHEVSHYVDHAQAWPKTARVFPREVIAALRARPFFQRLQEEFGAFELSDEEDFGWENLYWRLVRPGLSDIGPIHCDSWFWELGHGKMPSYECERVKIWIAIHTAAGKNGLLVVPGSHHRTDWKWHGEEKGGLLKPVLDENPDDLNSQLVETHPGQAVVFHDRLLHGGAENLAQTCRVSIELTMLVRPEK
jgi:hypothetical protein